jgi:hypothetical protein
MTNALVRNLQLRTLGFAPLTPTGLPASHSNPSLKIGTNTVVVAVPILLFKLGSAKPDEVAALFDITVPSVAVGSTCATTLNVAPLTAREFAEHEIGPATPTAGVTQSQPLAAVREKNVVPVGRVSESEIDIGLLGPALLTVMV